MITHNQHGDIEFRFYHPEARDVYLVGDFNDWNPTATKMAREENGEWVVTLTLPDGYYEFKYLADDVWQIDEIVADLECVPFACNRVLILNPCHEPAPPAG